MANNEMTKAAQDRLAQAAAHLASAARTYDKIEAGFRAGRYALALLLVAERCACRAEDAYKAARDYMDGLVAGIRTGEAMAQRELFAA